MMTIDDLLSQVAKIQGTVPKTRPEPEKKPREVNETVHKTTEEIPTRPILTLALAKEIIYCIEKGAEKMGIDAAFAVVNADGRLIAFEAMDNSPFVSITASQEKAYTAAALRMSTQDALLKSRGGALDGLTNGNGILLLGGGNPLYINGKLVGAVGVSGGTKEEDTELSMLGVRYLDERIKRRQ